MRFRIARMLSARFFGVAALFGVLVSGGVAATANAAGSNGSPCFIRSHHTTTLTEADSGRQIDVCQGESIIVQLRAPNSGGGHQGATWNQVRTSGHAVQTDRHHRRSFPPRGTTVGYFTAAHSGESQLSSSRPACAASLTGGPICHAMLGWNVTIDVR